MFAVTSNPCGISAAGDEWVGRWRARKAMHSACSAWGGMTTVDNIKLQTGAARSKKRTGFTNAVRGFARIMGPVNHVSPIAVLAIILSLAGVACIALTYATLTGVAPFELSRQALLVLVAVNGSIILAIALIIVWRLARLFIARRNHSASALHVRMVILFSFITLLPAGSVAFFSGVTLSLGLNSLLGEPVPAAIENSATMARFYVLQEANLLGPELQAMANDVNNSKKLFNESPIRFAKFLDFQIQARGLTAAYVTNASGVPLARAQEENSPDYTIPRSNIMAQAELGKVTIFSDVANSQARGILRLPDYDGGYLVISRAIAGRVLEHFAQTQSFIAEFDEIASNRNFIELIFMLTFIVITLMILLGAIWLGLRAANDLVSPIDRLVIAAEKVSEGNLSARVLLEDRDDEVSNLSHTFNRMTEQIQNQRDDLMEVNEQLDQRRMFTEAVLAGVSAGVLGLDGDRRINIVNRSAEDLLALPRTDLIDKLIDDVLPEIAQLLEQATLSQRDFVQEQLDLTIDGQIRHFNVQVTGHHGQGGEHGYVITLDDISKLVSAQRTAAWADVARRIAHEIKNPLTPIQLSAERLRRKYSQEIKSDRHIFEQCTDTIVRQVKDIGRMVDEFSSFARMPTPIMRDEDICDLIKRSVFAQRVANPDIDYQLSLTDEAMIVQCDGHLIGQALTNLLKNAGQAIAIKEDKLGQDGGRGDFTGKIDVALNFDDRLLNVSVVDNGCGLPKEHRNKLTEPYMTTHAKGTGLGLAIVQKIMEDHGGELTLEDAPEGSSGACVSLHFPRDQKRKGESNRPPREDVSETSTSISESKAVV